MNFSLAEVIDTLRCYVDIALFMLIWLVQLIIYPSFVHVRESVFIKWHNKYTGLISIFVAPLMFGQSGIYLYTAYSFGRWHDLFGCVCIAVVWLSTFQLSVPCHDRLHRFGYDLATIRRLVRTNWVRTLLWTIMLAITLLTISPLASLREAT